MEEYVAKRKDTISEYANDTNIFNKCMRASKIIKSDNSLEWWRKNLI